MDIRKGDVVAWPTNLGWMMGPWLVYASLLNGASMALYNGSPNSSGFAKFVQVQIKDISIHKVSIRDCGRAHNFVQIHHAELSQISKPNASNRK